MKNKDGTPLREAWVPKARGDVLEIGIGSGLNLPLYSSEVQRVVGVEPSLALLEKARRRGAAGRTKVDFLSQSARSRCRFPIRASDLHLPGICAAGVAR
jgi:protein-L-isoaspartate O-methyltransferase